MGGTLLPASQATEPLNASVTAAETCGQLTDVVTLTFNTQMMLLNPVTSQGVDAAAAQAYASALVLAGRMLSNVDVAAGSSLAEPVAALKDLVPTNAAARTGQVFSPMSPDAEAAFAAAGAACIAGGSEIGVAGWYGG